MFQPVDYLLISMHQWYCKSDMFAGDCSRRTVLRKNCHAQTPEKYCLIMFHPLFLFFFCTDLSRCFPKGGSYSALCYHSCHQRVNRSSCRIRNESNAELWPEGGLQFRACGPPIPAKIIQVGAVCVRCNDDIGSSTTFFFVKEDTHSFRAVCGIDRQMALPYSSIQTKPQDIRTPEYSVVRWLGRSIFFLVYLFRCFSTPYVHRSRSRSWSRAWSRSWSSRWRFGLSRFIDCSINSAEWPEDFEVELTS